MSEAEVLETQRISAYTEVAWRCSGCECLNRTRTNRPGLMSARCGRCHSAAWVRVTDKMLRGSPKREEK